MPSPFEIEVEEIVQSEHSDPFHILGAHPAETPSRSGSSGKGIAVRAFLPEAQKAWVIANDNSGSTIPMELIHPDGFFEAILNRKELFLYQLRVLTHAGQNLQFVDPYVFPPLLTEFDLY